MCIRFWKGWVFQTESNSLLHLPKLKNKYSFTLKLDCLFLVHCTTSRTFLEIVPAARSNSILLPPMKKVCRGTLIFRNSTPFNLMKTTLDFCGLFHLWRSLRNSIHSLVERMLWCAQSCQFDAFLLKTTLPPYNRSCHSECSWAFGSFGLRP